MRNGVHFFQNLKQNTPYSQMKIIANCCVTGILYLRKWNNYSPTLKCSCLNQWTAQSFITGWFCTKIKVYWGEEVKKKWYNVLFSTPLSLSFSLFFPLRAFHCSLSFITSRSWLQFGRSWHSFSVAEITFVIALPAILYIFRSRYTCV